LTPPGKKPVLKTLGLSLILVANVFLFTPFTLYVGNLDEFSTPIWPMLALYGVPALAITALLMVLGMAMGGDRYRRYTVLIATISLLLWLQGNALVWEYGLLDGQNIDWNLGAWRGWLDLGIWIAAILAAMVFYRTVERPIVHAAVVVFALQLVVLAYTGIQKADGLLAKSQARQSTNAFKQIRRFSSTQNVVHIILDGFQADVFDEIISNEIVGQHYRSALQGFTFFRENMGAFPTTYMAMPALLGGAIYRNHMPKNEFLQTVLGGKSILNAVFAAGYEVDFTGEDYWVGKYSAANHTNAYIVPTTRHATARARALGEAAKLLDLTLFRLSPHFLKKTVHNDENWLVQSAIFGPENRPIWFFKHTAFLNDIADNMTADRTAPVYKLIHSMNTHWPMVVVGNCEYAGGSLPRNRVTVTTQSKCSLDAVIRILDKMKELGIYKDALIVLMADHGAGLAPYRLKPTMAENGKDAVMMNSQVVSMATPLMAIKPPGASGPFRVSMAPSSTVDTAATMMSLLGLESDFDGRDMFELRPEEKRERRHYLHGWRRDDWDTDYFGPIQEFIVNGSVYDSAAWQAGEKFLPPD
jgi:hypothetical protein